MSVEQDDDMSVPDGIGHAERVRCADGDDLRCAGCGRDLDGEPVGDRSLLRDGLCDECRKERAEREAWERAHPDPVQRVIVLAEDEDATFVVDPEHTIWIRKGTCAFQLPYFDPTGYPDEELVAKLRIYVLFS